MILEIPSTEEMPDVLQQMADDIDLPQIVGESQINLENTATLMRLAAITITNLTKKLKDKEEETKDDFTRAP